MELLDALDADFVGYQALRSRLADESPRVGLNERVADSLPTSLYDWLADACEAERDISGLVVRPGTGTAMYYLWLARGRSDGGAPAGAGGGSHGRRASPG